MNRRGSIARWMVVVALAGLGAALLRSWLGPRNDAGELGPAAIVGLLGLAVAALTGGRVARFSTGLAASAMVSSLGFLFAPSGVRDRVFGSTVVPIVARLDSTSGITNEELMTLWAELGEISWGNSLPERQSWVRGEWARRLPFVTPRSQALLGLLQLPIALVGGTLASARFGARAGSLGRRDTPPAAPRPPDRP